MKIIKYPGPMLKNGKEYLFTDHQKVGKDVNLLNNKWLIKMMLVCLPNLLIQIIQSNLPPGV